MKSIIPLHCREAAPSFGAQRRTSFATTWRTSFAAALLAICATAQMATAAPAAFSYQGVLRDEQGAALPSKNQTVEFRLYAQAEGGSPIWGRAVAVLLDDNGLFSTELSDAAGSAINGVTGSGLASLLANNAGNALYIGLTVVGTSGEIAPRQTILPVPYAIVAGDVASASGDLPVSGQLSASSAEVSGTLRAGALDVADSVAASTLNVSGNASVGGDLSVAGTLGGYGAAPVGCIILWSGSASAIPDGWALCDGQPHNGRTTPDLRDRFVVGAGGAYNVGDKGGENTHTLTLAEMPSHNHSYSFTGADLKGSWDDDNYFYNQSEEYKNKTNEKYTNYTGGGQPHENRPPYYALCYIMRVR
jgi:microcystin-dependent protein